MVDAVIECHSEVVTSEDTLKDDLSKAEHLVQVSLSHKKLVDLETLMVFQNVSILNLPDNKIVTLDGISKLKHLTWINFSRNCLRNADGLRYCVHLRHIDLSENMLESIPELYSVCRLKTLLLHGNKIGSLDQLHDLLPETVEILSLANNCLNSIDVLLQLRALPRLQQISLKDNPLLNEAYEYTKLLVNLCPKLFIVDGRGVEMQVASDEELPSQSQFIPYSSSRSLSPLDTPRSSTSSVLISLQSLESDFEALRMRLDAEVGVRREQTKAIRFLLNEVERLSNRPTHTRDISVETEEDDQSISVPELGTTMQRPSDAGCYLEVPAAPARRLSEDEPSSIDVTELDQVRLAAMRAMDLGEAQQSDESDLVLSDDEATEHELRRRSF